MLQDSAPEGEERRLKKWLLFALFLLPGETGVGDSLEIISQFLSLKTQIQVRDKLIQWK